MNIPYVFKRCTKCGEWLVASKVNYNKGKKCKYGLKSECRQCQKQYYNQNKEHYKEYRKEYYEQNKEHINKR